MGAPKGKHAFGMVTVGEKGQIVIPKKAREIFDIKPGDSLLILGDEKQGLAIVKGETVARLFSHLTKEDIESDDSDKNI